MNPLLIVSIAVVAVVWVATLVDLVRRRLDARHTIAWTLLVLVLPILGALIYWVERPAPPDEARRAVGGGSGARFY